MLNKVCLAFAGALTFAPQLAFAADISSRCVDIAVPKERDHGAQRQVDRTEPEQWQFLRGIYVVNPETPAGLPYGNKAVLAQVDGNAGGLVFFIDGDKACTPMAIPHELLAMMHEVATETINHETGGL